MQTKGKYHFIPLSREELEEKILEIKTLNKEENNKLKKFFFLLKSIYHYEFHNDLEKLKSSYKNFNPDISLPEKGKNTKDIKIHENELILKIKEIFSNGNYIKITKKELDEAINEEGILPISTQIEFSYFEYYEIYFQGMRTVREEIKTWNPFKNKNIEFVVYDRIVFFFKLKDKEFFNSIKIKDMPGLPGKIYLKYFRNIPKLDLETIFPNPKPKMKNMHRIKIITPLLVGLSILFHKIIVQPYFLKSTNSPLEDGFGLGLIALLIALGGYVLKVYNGYKNTVQKFLSEITQSLYFKDVGNNQGVFSSLIDSAEEEECKESMLAYFFLFKSEEKLDEHKLDDLIETWLRKKHDIDIDFEVSDAIRKLIKLNIIKINQNGILSVTNLDESLTRMDQIWDNYFSYNK